MHYVLDQWFHGEALPRVRGRAFLIRYADDFVIGFTEEEEARRVWEVLPKRFSKYGLTIHPEKTRLVSFERPRRGTKPPRGHRPETFDFPGFTHYWARSRKGNWVIKRKTASDRFTRAVQAISDWRRKNRHRPVPEQHKTLCQKFRGHFNYYGITGNSKALVRFRYEAIWLWYKWLRRRHRERPPWSWFARLLVRHELPLPRAIHSEYRVAKS